MAGLIKLIAAAALALVIWLAISGTSLFPQAPPRPPETVPPSSTPPSSTPPSSTPPSSTPPASIAPSPTAAHIAKLNDMIDKLTAAVDKLNQRVAELELSLSRSGGSSSRPSPTTSDAPSRQEIYARQTARRPSWRDRPCWW